MRFLVALPVLGSAILLISCGGEGQAEESDYESFLTQQSDTLVLISSESGRKNYRFETPLLERYELAKEPYMEFRRGIQVETYDSLGAIRSTLVANYAIFLEKQELWEAKGNVIATNAQGRKLETQQLFWNQKTKKVYSNVDSKVTQESGDVIIGESFESDESFEVWEFRRTKGKVFVDTQTNENPDSAAVARDTVRVVGEVVTPKEPSKPARGSENARLELRRSRGSLSKDSLNRNL